jgi:CubicO group peptidase (beta-lactamase class C family)
LAYTSVLGSADVERGKPLKADSLFRIYSMTKPVTSVAFMMLVEEGKVSLDDPVHRFIPAWRDLGVFVAGVAWRVPDQAHGRADADDRPAAPHLWSYVRLPAAHQCRRGLSQAEAGRRR